MPEPRQPQLAYSEAQALMLDEPSRRAKAQKMAAILQHFLGTADLSGLFVADVGCSGGIVADELARAGATVVGLDIDRPGIAKAQAQFGASVRFIVGDSQAIPLRDGAVDIVICNHVYEHVVAPHALMAEIRRVVRPTGAVYLGLGNRLGVMEPHYRLPFLSWLPRPLAHRYVRASGRADHYHEAFATRPGLRRLVAGMHVWDYTLTALTAPATFAATDAVPGWVSKLPLQVLRVLRPLLPTYLWIATTVPSSPQGPPQPVPPEPVTTR